MAEESDGISVISETEICKQVTSTHNSENEAEKFSDVDDEVAWTVPYQPPTPPATPKIDEKVSATRRSDPPRNLALLAVVLTVVLGFYWNANSIRADVQEMGKRVAQLELENQLLKEALDQMQLRFKETSDLPIAEDLVIPVPPDTIKPKTRTVWVGDEEKRVEILDKRQGGLPSYCYFTESDDLFYEYNAELCEQKKRKLAAGSNKNNKKKIHAKQEKKCPLVKPDEQHALKIGDEKSIDDHISEMLKSIDDDVQKIKLKRTSDEHEVNAGKTKSKEIKMKYDKFGRFSKEETIKHFMELHEEEISQQYGRNIGKRRKKSSG